MELSRLGFLLDQITRSQTDDGVDTDEAYDELLAAVRLDTSGELMARITSWLEQHSADSRSNLVTHDRNYWQAAFDEVLAAGKMNDLRTASETESAPSIPRIPVYARVWFRYAAAILVVFSIGYFFIQHEKTTNSPAAKQIAAKPDIAPGSNKATLTLSNGSKIILDSAHTGLLANQSGSSVTKINSGSLHYSASNEKTSTLSYNTLSTPRGGQYQLILPDGSKVWLNAASSITYPTAFNSKERKVSITGEAYFEIVHNGKLTFIVSANGAEIKDIGTSFDINAYPDEPAFKATLVSGIVSVNGTQLKPGEQANISNNKLTISTANISQTLAWKNGEFHFDSSDIGTVMRQISRWYGVDVSYQDNIRNHFTGIISRSVYASQVLSMLESTGTVHFKIAGKTVTVMK